MSKLLIVVDMQNDFITGTLANPSAADILPYITDEMDTADHIIFTRDTHEYDYLQTMEGKNLPIEHCIRNTEGWQVHINLIKHLNTLNVPHDFINKATFGFRHWEEFIDLFSNFDEIELVGTCTDICVITNALIIKTLCPEKTITVRKSACAGVTKEKHEAALETMRSCQINVIE